MFQTIKQSHHGVIIVQLSVSDYVKMGRVMYFFFSASNIFGKVLDSRGLKSYPTEVVFSLKVDITEIILKMVLQAGNFNLSL